MSRPSNAGGKAFFFFCTSVGVIHFMSEIAAHTVSLTPYFNHHYVSIMFVYLNKYTHISDCHTK